MLSMSRVASDMLFNDTALYFAPLASRSGAPDVTAGAGSAGADATGAGGVIGPAGAAFNYLALTTLRFQVLWYSDTPPNTGIAFFTSSVMVCFPALSGACRTLMP